MPGMQIIGTTKRQLDFAFRDIRGNWRWWRRNLWPDDQSDRQRALSRFVSVNVGAQTITTSGTPAPAITVGTTFTLNSNTYVVTQVNGGGKFHPQYGEWPRSGNRHESGDHRIVGDSCSDVRLPCFLPDRSGKA